MRLPLSRVTSVLGPALALCALAAPAQAHDRGHHDGNRRLEPGNLLISSSRYEPADIQPGVTVLPPGCLTSCVTATNDGTYPTVFSNVLADSSFGVTSKIYLQEVSPWGEEMETLPVPSDQLVTSFSSKSELALNLSTNGEDVTFMGYVAPARALDVSNSNTPAALDPTNPVPGSDYRAVAVLDEHGRFHFTETNAYSGNNGRAAVLNNAGNVIYTAGNAGNGANPQPNGVVLGAGTQIMTPSFATEASQTPGPPTPVGSFSVTQLGDKADKVGKDDNFRGLTVFNNVVYLTKGSGSNGVNTVYFIDTTGKACPNGTGVPAAGAKLPTAPLSYDPSTLQTTGLPSNMCILSGFPTLLAKSASNTSFPFGLWFANAHTLYVADEGNGTDTFDPASGTYTAAAAQTTAGLQKWVFDTGSNSWKLAYTLDSGLNLGQPYVVPGYPTGNNPATGLPWAPATDGLRNITGHVNRDGTVTVYGVTSTVSGGGDQGADPNKVVKITDSPSATSAAAGESFSTLRSAAAGEVLRGVSLTPSGDEHHGPLAR
jgi:hypothetical protein